MRVAFVLPTLEPSGGIHVALRHADALRERAGWEVAVVVDGDARGLSEAAAREWDVVVSTWWTTADAALELPARRHVVLLQGLDERFYGWGAPLDRLAAATALAGADAVVAVSRHLGEVVSALRPDLPVRVVPAALDRATFDVDAARSSVAATGPLRVLVEGQENLPLKGVADAIAAVRGMREPVQSTLVALDPTVVNADGVDRLVGALSPGEMAALYFESDVVLKLSRAEGLGLPPLEAAAMGTPSVVTPYGGHEDWLRHGVNGVQVGFDDIAGTSAWLDVLARERALLARLGRGALETARGWPTPEESAEAFAVALREICDSPPADPEAVRRAVARAIARNLEPGRIGVERAMKRHKDRHIEMLVSSKTYRVAEGMRRVWWSAGEAAARVRRGRSRR
jgi:O-antigen biosynthesis protein